MVKGGPGDFLFFLCFLLADLDHPAFIFCFDLIFRLLHLFKGECPLWLLILFFPSWQRFCNYYRAVQSANHALNVVMQFKLSFWERTLNKATLSVTKLTAFIVTPKEESSVLKCYNAMASATNQLFYQKWRLLFVLAIIHFRDVLH